MTEDIASLPMKSHARRSAETWALARADYLSGDPAALVCERHGLSLSTFRWRARTENWRRADHPNGTPFVALDECDLIEIDQGLPLNAADMSRLAWSNAVRAMRESLLLEARGWTRLHGELTRLAKDDSERRSNHLRWAANPARAHHVPTAPPLRPVEED